MGSIVDTCVFITQERRGYPAQDLRANLGVHLANQPFALTSVSLAELVAGIYQAKTPQQSARRRAFVEEVALSFQVIPFTRNTAWIAGQVRGEQAKIGNTLPIADSLIAAAALQFDYAVITLNLIDFTRIPNLRVIPFTLP